MRFYEVTSVLSSPVSVLSQIDKDRSREKAEQLLGTFVSLLSESPDCYMRFSAALPLTRIYLLLLGDKPSSFVAKQVLDLIALSLDKSKSFSRKFELVSGWTIVKTVIPDIWDANIHAAAFGILLGQDRGQEPFVTCSHIFPAILGSLTSLLAIVAHESYPQGVDATENSVCNISSLNGRFLLTRTLEANGRAATNVEAILEELIVLQSSCPTFRELFESQQTTQTFIKAFQSFVARLSSSDDISRIHIRASEKLMHFALTLALDNAVAGPQKREVC